MALKKHGRPLIIAHRGARDQAPENTLAALELALKYDICGVEFDVQMTLDHQPVLYHDRTLFKVGAGSKRISQLNAADLSCIDWGRWYDSRFSGEPLPTLDRALSMVNRCPNMCVEIKSDVVDRASGRIDLLTDKVIEYINRPDTKSQKDHILIFSFDPGVLARAYKMEPGIRYVLNLSDPAQLDDISTTRHLWAIDMAVAKLSKELVQWTRNRKLRLFTYTCNGPRQVNKAVRLGVDAVITDRPAWLAQYFGRE